MSFSYVLIGEESLTIRCAELLKSRGHLARAVVADRDLVRDWAANEGLRTLRTSDRTALAGLESFDYLLSIVNLRMLSPETLRLPSMAAINFHDGPLPRHAGLNAPVWALVEGDRTFGVTWHLMEAEADTGNLLEQQVFDLDADESALSLNLKCFEAAYESFERLVDRLERGDIVGTPQDLTARTYHNLAEIPAAGGIIDFASPAEEIVRLVQALNFGEYDNPLTLPKLVTQSGCVTVSAADLDVNAHGEPGRVLAAAGSAATFGTASGGLRLSGFKSLSGEPLQATDALQRLGLTVEGVYPVPNPQTREAYSTASRLSAASERRAISALNSTEAITLPALQPTVQTGGLERVDSGTSVGAPELIVATLGNLVARLSGNRIPLWVLQSAPANFTPELRQLYSHRLPVAFDPVSPRAADDPRITAAISPAPLTRDFAVRTKRIHARPGDRVAISLGKMQEQELDGLDLVLQLDEGDSAQWVYRRSRFDADAIHSLDEALRASLAAGGAPTLGQQHRKAFQDLNRTARPFACNTTISEEFEAAVRRHPERKAVTGGGRSLSYTELNARANALATKLRELGASPDSLVAIHMERSVDILTALLGVQKASAAYVPVDPAYPEARKRLMIEDSGAPIILTSKAIAADVAVPGRRVLVMEDEALDFQDTADLPQAATADSLAYVIYTSGSTGRPKGVMLTHRNANNFFAGMDDRIGTDPGTWLAVTSISFDISILELLWTVTRGFTVVIHGAPQRLAAETPAFSLFFFASDSDGRGNAYDLVMRASRFADEHGFEAVWTPERHFHAFGGAFPNPSVVSAAIAASTKHIQIRAGSCVLPLHSPIRVAEEWAVVDNISNGRVGVSFAAGWQPDDFVLKPESFGQSRDAMFRDIPVVQALWRGDSREFPGPDGRAVSVRVLPRPIQLELPTWVTSAGDPETFRLAGEMGLNILTHLLGQSVESVQHRIQVYRDAWNEAGHRGQGRVTLMLHTFIGEADEAVREAVREPMIRYLASSVGLIKQFAASFPTFKSLPGDEGANDLLHGLSEAETRELLEAAFDRYYETSGLFGTRERAAGIVSQLQGIGVDEIACLVDFGLPDEEAMGGLERLAHLKDFLGGTITSESIAALIHNNGVTHLQCTPSMAAMMVAEPENKAAFGQLRKLLVGGEALPADLAKELVEATPNGDVLNMYGPTETAIWSTTCPVRKTDVGSSIGRPIANTSVYILDAQQQEVPVGMTGELWIGGEGVACGYLGRPELTAERFVADPFSAAPAARMYRTGDLARLRRDGEIEFLGRLDQQVKVRGYRIEPGEIESALRSIAGVTEAVVVAREDDPGDQRLVAYYVAPPEQRSTDSEFRGLLAQSLPEYMVPTNFVRLDRLPLTPNAKVDRKALPAPGHQPIDAVPLPAPAAARLETSTTNAQTLERVATTWQQILRVPEVPLDRSFFDLGGNSLLMLQVHKRMKQSYPELRLTDLFKYPTVRSLSAHLDDNSASTTQPHDALSRASARRAALTRRPVTA